MINTDYKKNKNFYPTPKKLFKKMFGKIKKWHNIQTILEPSAGTGTLCDFLKEELRYYNHDYVVIEKDEELRKELISKQYKLIDSDFLTYDNSVQCDLIFANFPFSEGDKHLLKAIDCIYSGQIVALINAETIKNPYSSSRKELALKLKQLNAEIEFLKDEFKDAERNTSVEIALVYINKEASFEDEIKNELKKDEEVMFDFSQTFDITTSNDLLNLVKMYEKEKELVSKQLIDFYQNYHYIGHVLALEIVGSDNHYRYREDINLTQELKSKLNQLNAKLKKNYWSKLIKEDKISKNLTKKKKEALRDYIKQFNEFAFNEYNVKIVMTNILEKFSSSIDEAILELFEEFTKSAVKDSRWSDEEYSANIHYYNAWKNNSSYKLNKKVIVRFYKASQVMAGKSLYTDERYFIEDIIRVVSYFDPSKTENAIDVIESCLKKGITKKIKVNSLLFTFFKKGTIHIEFTDENILRSFNIAVGKLRGDLPMDYSEKAYSDLNNEEKDLVNNFESSKEYVQKPTFKGNQLLLES